MIILHYLFYYLVLIPISLLPFPVLYFLSDMLYVILYKLAGYRKKVVLNNIRKSFPSKSAHYHESVASGFYHHLCDLVVESIKIFTISEKQVMARMSCKNPEVMNRFWEEGRHVVISGGHYNNWELFAVAVHQFIRHHPVGIYKPLTNKFFDRKMQETRGKFGLEMLATSKVKQYFESGMTSPAAVIFGIDQSPSKAASSYWMKFLEQDTAVSFGAEKYAKDYQCPVVFGRLKKLKRGHYELEFELITEHPETEAYGFITEKGTRLLEQDIREAPEFWLWSHRRWKKKKPEVVDVNPA